MMVVAVASIGVIVAMSAIMWLAVLADVTSDVWDPIEELPDQRVVEVTSNTITVEGIKCYREATEVFGTVTWQSVSPAGILLPVAEGVATRDAGCIDFTGEDAFVNPIPPEARALQDQYTAAGRGVIQWRITGRETPISPDGLSGVPRAWRTDPFRLPTD